MPAIFIDEGKDWLTEYRKLQNKKAKWRKKMRVLLVFVLGAAFAALVGGGMWAAGVL